VKPLVERGNTEETCYAFIDASIVKPMKHHTQDKGDDIGILKAQVDLALQKST